MADFTLNSVTEMGGAALLTPREAASALRVSTRTLDRWRAQGLGPKPFRIGRLRLAYRAGDVLAFASSQTA